MSNKDSKQLQGWLEEYQEWIEKDIPVAWDWEEEVHYMTFIRDEIERYKQKASSQQLEKLIELDRLWRKQIEKETGKLTSGIWWKDKKVFDAIETPEKNTRA